MTGIPASHFGSTGQGTALADAALDDASTRWLPTKPVPPVTSATVGTGRSGIGVGRRRASGYAPGARSGPRIGTSPILQMPNPCQRAGVDAPGFSTSAMHLAALIAFGIGAIFGLSMAVNHFRGVESGMAIGIVHGLFAASGLVMLFVGLRYAPALDAWPAFWAFVVTAAGGAFLFYRQITGKKWPTASSSPTAQRRSCRSRSCWS